MLKSPQHDGFKSRICTKLPCIIKLMENFQSQVTSGANSVSQYMAVEALRLTRDDYHHEVSEFKNKRDFVISELESCGIKVEGANGAFYIFFKIPGDANSEEFCEKLLREEKLALVPGIAFGMEGYARISYASDINTIRKGMERLTRFVKKMPKMIEP